MKLMVFLFIFGFLARVNAQDSLSYSGRLLNPATGVPLTVVQSLKFDLVYSDNTTIIKCTKTVNATPVRGVFQVNLYFGPAGCAGGKSLTQVLSEMPAGIKLAYLITANGHTFPAQITHSVPTASMASVAKVLAPPAAPIVGDVLTWDAGSLLWLPRSYNIGAGTLVTINAGTGIVATPAGSPVDSYTLSIANSGIDTDQLAASAVTNDKVAVGAAIARNKLAAGTPTHVMVNDFLGFMSSVAALPVSSGGTGAITAAGARTNLGLVKGFDTTNVLGATSVPTCDADEKLKWDGVAPFTGWSCVADLDGTIDATKLPLAGGTMAGAIAMSTTKITGLPTPTAANEIATKLYVDDHSFWTLTTGNINRASGRVGIGAATAPEALLDLTSITQGFLMPRMTTAQRNLISPVPEGLEIYNISTNEINYHNGTAWMALAVAGSGVTSVIAGTGLSGGTITTTGTIAIAVGGVGNTQLAASAVTDAKVATAAAIARAKLAAGTADHILVNDGAGVMSSVASLPISAGGTAGTTAPTARTALGLGTAAVANIGSAAGNVMGAGAVPNCTAAQKLSVTGNTWSCITDTDLVTDATKLPLAGGTMAGAIAMSTTKITGFPTPTAANEIATKSYVDDHSFWTLTTGNINRASGRVGIGAATAPEALLDLTSITQGFLMPRMTTAQRNLISPVPEGLEIYNISTNEINYHNGTAWMALAVAGSGVTSVIAGTGLSGGTITTTGTIAIAVGGVGNTQLAASAVTDAKVATAAAITRTKLAAGTADHVLINDGSGVMSSVASLPISAGGTAGTTAPTARTALGLGTAAVANIGSAAGNVMGAGAVPNCTAAQKLSVTGNTWSCITDTDLVTDATKLPLAGGTMAGAIAMSTTKITGLPTPTDANEIATKLYVDDHSFWTLTTGNINRASGRVGIGAATAPEALLDLTSITQGFLMPRMTTAQRNLISPVTEGLEIYNISTNEVNYHNGTAWTALAPAGSFVTSVIAGTGLSGGTINSTGTIAIAVGGVGNTQLAASAVTDAKVATAAAIARTKLASGTADHILVNDGAGVMSSVATLPVTKGGTGINVMTADKLYVSNTAATAFEALSCLTATFLSFDTLAKIVCPALLTATGGGSPVAGIVTIASQTFAGLKTFAGTAIAAEGVQVGAVATACVVGTKGITRFVTASKKIEICNGTTWAVLGSSSDPCYAATPTLGTVCNKGAIYAGTQSSFKYMTTPGGCGEINFMAIVGAGVTAYPSTDFTPICSGTDAITKQWNNGTSFDTVGLTNYTTTVGTGNGAINVDANFGSANTTIVAAITAGANGGFHPASRYCERLIYGGYSDWFLPNRFEMDLIYTNKGSLPGLGGAVYYWTSTENTAANAWALRMSDGSQNVFAKSSAAQIRCMRKY